jgi:hypothetical protein
LSFFKIFALSCLAIDALASIYFWLAHGFGAFINLHIALAGSLAILFAAFYGYKKAIEKGVENKPVENQEEITEEIAEENERIEGEEAGELPPSKMSILKESYKGFLFPLRLAAYAIFAFSFIYLSSNELLVIAPFLVGLGIVPFAVLLAMGVQRLTVKNSENQPK